MQDSTYPNLHATKYNQELHYGQFAVKLDKCAGSCKDFSNRVSVQIKQKV